VRTAYWHIQRNLFGIAQFKALPVEIGGGVGPQIYDYIENNAVRTADELCLPGTAAHVQGAHHTPRRARLAVLDEASRVNPSISRYLCVECAREEAALIDVRRWLEQERSADAGRAGDLHMHVSTEKASVIPPPPPGAPGV
jgi:hypothetical protein